MSLLKVSKELEVEEVENIPRISLLKRRSLVILMVVAVVALGIGIGIGVGISERNGITIQPSTAKVKMESTTKVKRRDGLSAEKERFKHHKTIIGDMKADNIKNVLQHLTKYPNNAGTKVGKDQAEWVAKKWREYGFDDVKIHMYEIVLSFPLSPGKFELLDDNGTRKYGVDEVLEPAVEKSEIDSRVLLPFNAYSAAGTVEGELVYANYGREQDFTHLEGIGINITGKIVLTRYGKTSRSSKVARSQRRGANGVIIYSDPKDWAPRGDYFPKGWELPLSGIQRGTISRRQGDALSREYPSKEGMYRPELKNLRKDYFPTIPSQPISANQTIPLLRLMDGTPAPADFQGNLNVVYRYNSSGKVRLTVNTTLESRKTYSVTAKLYGKTEPDRLVILGNHRDSWVFGAADATSGQAVLIEIARALGAMKKTGWRPRRTIMVCSWDAEEYGIMASTEWVEDHGKMLRERAIAYLNMDIAVEGNYSIRLRSTPELDEAFFAATKQLKSPNDENKVLYDDWLQRLPSDNPKEPKIYMVSSGSDYKPFSQNIGMPCTDHRYMFDKTTTKVYPYMYPMYHSLHDTFYWASKFLDPDFKYHLSVGQMWIQLTLNLADSTIIPFNLQRGAAKIKMYADKFETDHQKKYLNRHNISSKLLVEAATNLSTVATEFHKSLSKIDKNDPLQVRMANDKMMLFQRSFIHDVGIFKGKDIGTTSRHTVYSSTSYFMEKGNKFAGVLEAIYRAVHKWNGDWNDVKKQLSLVVYHMQQATRSLEKMKMTK